MGPAIRYSLRRNTTVEYNEDFDFDSVAIRIYTIGARRGSSVPRNHSQIACGRLAKKVGHPWFITYRYFSITTKKKRAKCIQNIERIKAGFSELSCATDPFLRIKFTTDPTFKLR